MPVKKARGLSTGVAADRLATTAAQTELRQARRAYLKAVSARDDKKIKAAEPAVARAAERLAMVHRVRFEALAEQYARTALLAIDSLIKLTGQARYIDIIVPGHQHMICGALDTNLRALSGAFSNAIDNRNGRATLARVDVGVFSLTGVHHAGAE